MKTFSTFFVNFKLKSARNYDFKWIQNNTAEQHFRNNWLLTFKQNVFLNPKQVFVPRLTLKKYQKDLKAFQQKKITKDVCY
jgi:hypothetical protein